MNIIEGGITSARGFRAAGICAGIKKDRKDMAMLYSEVPCTLAGTFTSNLVKASPVIWDRGIWVRIPALRANHLISCL